ncbi:MAG: C25 family cysteine peptidase [Candidatus Eisenbacteria bacterium]|nr:C25 family cysteine peptidase [Candidatus Eisenbacteria bacterium]
MRKKQVLVISSVCLALWSTVSLGRPPDAKLLASGEDGMTISFELPAFNVTKEIHEDKEFSRIEVAGFPFVTTPGLPMLPMSPYLLAVPFGVDLRVRIVSKEAETISGIIPLPAPKNVMMDGDFPAPGLEFFYDASFYLSGRVFPEDIANLGKGGAIRDQRVVELSVFPFQYDAGKRKVLVWKKIVLRIDFAKKGRKLAEPQRVPVQEEVLWEDVYKNTIFNYEEGKRWRGKLVSEKVRFGVQESIAQGPELKLSVGRTSIYKATFSDLSAKGFPSDVPISEIALYEKTYSPSSIPPQTKSGVPILKVDENGDDVFNGADYIIFYGLSYKDRFSSSFPDSRYSNKHTYWLSRDSGLSVDMPSYSGWRNSSSPTIPASFVQWRKFEVDAVYDNSPDSLTWDNLYWEDFGTKEPAVPYTFQVYDPDPLKPFGIRASFRGKKYNDHFVSLYLKNGLGKEETVVQRAHFAVRSRYIFNENRQLSLSDTTLTSGTNSFRFFGETLCDQYCTTCDGPYCSDHGSDAYFDWFEVGYYRRYRARGDSLEFSSGGTSGELELRVGKFGLRDIVLFNITNPLLPRVVEVDTTSMVSLDPSDQTYGLSFQDSVSSERTYAAYARRSLPLFPAGDIVLDASSSLSSLPKGSDYVMVVYDAFREASEELADHRRSKGLSVEVVSLSDVYDEFSGGDSSPDAILRFLKFAYENWNPRPLFLTLVGDASADYKHVLATSDSNFVPTYMLLSPVNGPAGRELVGSDHWFVTGLSDPTDDKNPDMYVGRLPVGSPVELRNLIRKVKKYEEVSSSDSWRGKGLLIADDQYSGGLFGTTRYCKLTGEGIFRTISQRIKQMASENPTSKDFVFKPFYLDSVIPNDPSFVDQDDKSCRVQYNVLDYVNRIVNPGLLSELAGGFLLVNYQGHANQLVLSHEDIICMRCANPLTVPPRPRYDTVTGEAYDITNLSNLDRPFIFFAFACHTGAFENINEKRYKDSLAERLLFAQRKGAVATFASTAYEWLPSSYENDFNRFIFEAFFHSPPVASIRRQESNKGRWFLGEVIATAEIRYLALRTSVFEGAVETYTLLGDPALMVDALPPSITVKVDGTETADGARIEVSARTDSVTIEATASDEVSIGSVSVDELISGSSVPVDTSLYSTWLIPEGWTDAKRVYGLKYRARLRPENYSVRLHATDWIGRESIFNLTVGVDVRALVNGKIITFGQTGADVPSPASARVTVEVMSPVPLNPDSIDVELAGTAQGFTKTPLDGLNKDWRLEKEIYLEKGRYELVLRILGSNIPDRRATLVVTEELAFSSVFNYPNPFETETEFHYTLLSDARSVRIRVLTVSGRLVTELNGATSTGENAVAWNGQDSSGLEVPNGVYFYKLAAESPKGKKISKIGKAVKLK